jgi:hypothetical protein
MTLPQGAEYSLTESALSPFQAEPTHRERTGPLTQRSSALCGRAVQHCRVSQADKRTFKASELSKNSFKKFLSQS